MALYPRPKILPMKRKSESQQQTLNKYFNIREYVTWKSKGSVLIGEYQTMKPTSKIAGFDFDGTLASYKGSYAFPKDPNDWRWFDPTIPIVLTHLATCGYTIVIFSNQKNIEKNAKRKKIFQGRIEKTVQELERYCLSIDVQPPPVLILAATEDDSFRKPRIGMWYLLESMYPINFSISNSFYCGDAAGRQYIGHGAHSPDHADTDRKWALNLGMDFYVPHQLFNDHCVEKYKETNKLHSHDDPLLPTLEFDPREFQNQFTIPELHSFDMILCVGAPASGKSHFCAIHLKEFIHVSQDILKTKQACIKSVQKALDAGLKVVVDNTNPKKETRKEYITMAKGKRVACLWFTSSQELCEHNNAFREHHGVLKALKESGDYFPLGKHVPQVAMHSFWKYLEEPCLSEGFSSIVKVPFSPIFPDPNQEALWRQFYR